MAPRFLSAWFGKNSTRSRKSRPPRRRALLELESLETRATPTVVFVPHFGVETVSGSNEGMQDPPVYLIFSGSYWNTTQGQQDELTLTVATENILSGPYLSGLAQYGSSGTARFSASWQDDATLPNYPSASALTNFLANQFAEHGNSPEPAGPQYTPIYVVVSEPTSPSPNPYN